MVAQRLDRCRRRRDDVEAANGGVHMLDLAVGLFLYVAVVTFFAFFAGAITGRNPLGSGD